jgi:hypothetical protein
MPESIAESTTESTTPKVVLERLRKDFAVKNRARKSRTGMDRAGAGQTTQFTAL